MQAAEEKELLTTRELAKWLRSTPGAVGKARCIRSRNYPPYIKIGRRVLYRRVDVADWLKEHVVDPRKEDKR
jgi:hypothetical protein